MEIEQLLSFPSLKGNKVNEEESVLKLTEHPLSRNSTDV